MADILSNIQKINDVEVSLDANLSEQLFNKIGANINGLIDSLTDYVDITTSQVWQVPEGVEKILIYSVAGGGGGGSGGTATSGSCYGGGGGGGGGIALNSYLVTPLENLTITIGAGGAGGAAVTAATSKGNNGTAGGDTIVTGLSFSHKVYGGGYGAGGSTSLGAAIGPGGNSQYSNGGQIIGAATTSGGPGGAGMGFGGDGGSSSLFPTDGRLGGGGAGGDQGAVAHRTGRSGGPSVAHSLVSTGGTGGANITGGGGGGSALGVGGNGSNGVSGSNSAAGGNGTLGGGGGGSGGSFNGDSGAGGTGGNGFVRIIW